MPTDTKQITKKLSLLPDAERKNLLADALAATAALKWMPNVGPQTQAYFSEADLLLYGGAGGSGKSGLLVGLAVTRHYQSLLMRRQYTDVQGLIDDCLEKNGTRNGFNGSAPARLTTPDGRVIDFGAAKNPGDEESWKGRPRDFLGIDEASQWLEAQVRFLMGWVRSTRKDVKCRTVLATNPPDKPGTGEWLIEMFAPWLDNTHPDYPEAPGKLRWYITNDEGKDTEVPDNSPVTIGDRIYQPQSRTFIPGKLADNPYLGKEYEAQLDSLPEPLRSAVRDGNWMIAHDDDLNQLIPTNWVAAAQDRWQPTPPPVPMSALACDVAQGGVDDTVISTRFDGWFSELVSVPGKDTPLGSDVAALVIRHRRDGCAVTIDAGGGYGGAAIERLTENNVECYAYRGAEKATTKTKDGTLKFTNRRSEALWRFREALDPDQPGGSPIALPPDQKLMAQLTAPRFEVGLNGIQAEPKEELVKRLGRSPDRADAVIMCWFKGTQGEVRNRMWGKTRKVEFPKVNRGHENQRRTR